MQIYYIQIKLKTLIALFDKKMQGPRHMIRQRAHNATKETQLCSVEQMTRQGFNQLMKRMIMKVTNCR